MSLGLLVGAFVFKVFVEKNCAEWLEFGNYFVSLHPNNINLVRNVAGVSASDDDLHAFGGSAGTLPHTKAVTLSVCFNVTQISRITQIFSTD